MLKSLFVFAALVASVSATSSAESIDICDAMSDAYGCAPDRYPLKKGVQQRLDCMDKASKIMHWATRPVHTDTYRLYVGDEDAPTTKYTPGKLHEVSIRVTKHRQVYRGLLLYAKAGGKKVGDWELPVDEPQLFQNPASCPGTVMHTSAEHKPYLVTFQWRAPAKGTGDVTFECLIKYGDANTGDFYYPNKDGLVTLQEGSEAAEADIKWVRSDLGESCTDACATSSTTDGYECVEGELAKINSVDSLKAAVADEHVCKLPYLRGCGAIGPSSSADNFCYYHLDHKCPEFKTPTCDAKSDNEMEGHRFCPCRKTGKPPVKVDPKDPTGPKDPTDGLAVYGGLYKPSKTCKPGFRFCPCDENAKCVDAADNCIGYRPCEKDDADCQAESGICVQDCVGEEDCECDVKDGKGRCLGDDLECLQISSGEFATGICAKKEMTSSPVTSANVAMVSIGVVVSSIVALF